jgi:septal ring factor EnvC (AmiA/AmiB activator)
MENNVARFGDALEVDGRLRAGGGFLGLYREIATQQAAIEKLKKDQTRLENLVASIDKRLERERAAEEATARAEEAKRAAAAQKNQKPIAPLPSGSFAQSKGRLIRPVSGRVAAGFGSRRTGSAVWQGILFSAPEGAEVSACAAGRVVFSDWLRGYGNLLIIDHGGTYMSVYANNESVLKNVGDKVAAGETISTVGTSGASDEPGLYFEIRYKGKPINPQPWLAK